MAIWRGPGGPGDAVPDQANSAQLAENFANAAAASATAASTSASNAAASAAAALVSESNSSSSASQASASESNAAASAAAALVSEQAAAVSEANALASEQAAALSESNAASSESNAAASEANALASEQAAALSESNAASSESNAAASESKAQQWATEAEDVPVETSPTNLYSAFHWAQKSEDFAQTINPTDYVTVANNQTITGVKTFDNGLATDTISEETTAAGVTIDGVLLKDSEVTTDVIKEKTSAAGVTVDGVLLKDSQVSTDQINEKTSATGVTIDGVLLKDSEVSTDVINEKTSAAGVTIDGVLLKDSEVTTDVIKEKTSATGVTIDGVLLKDSAVSAPDGGTFTKTTATTNAVTQVLRIDSQSSGTPANGIGVGMEFATETAAGNTEIGATIEAITTDVTGASEDFDLSIKTMAAGAAAAERVRIKSTGDFQFDSGYGSVATAYGCRAWVNFNGTGTVAIREDGNVSSITDNGTGDYTVNFTTAMPDANYVVAGTCGGNSLGVGISAPGNGLTQAAGSVRIVTGTPSAAFDPLQTQLAIFR